MIQPWEAPRSRAIPAARPPVERCSVPLAREEGEGERRRECEEAFEEVGWCLRLIQFYQLYILAQEKDVRSPSNRRRHGAAFVQARLGDAHQ